MSDSGSLRVESVFEVHCGQVHCDGLWKNVQFSTLAENIYIIVLNA